MSPARYLDGELWTANYGASGRNVSYNIDQMGNRTSVVDTGVTTTYTQAAGGLNQYGQVGTNTVGNGSEHEIALYQNIAYGYVNDERLASVSGNGHNYALLYDALGRCVKRTLDNATTFYIYDGEKPIAEYNSAGGVVARNLYGKGIDEILMRIDATLGTFYYQDDHEGSVTHLTSAAGAILERYRYDVFGAPSISDANGNPLNPPNASAFNSRFMFTGREYTSVFGIYEYRARAYHPGLGRFTGEDPKGFDAGDYNLFRYCHNDPEDLTDPMGLEFEDQGYTLTTRTWPGDFGRTYGAPELVGHPVHESGGWRIQARDVNLRTNSVVQQYSKQSYDPNPKNWVKGLDLFKRDQANVDRTIHHEGEHRNNRGDWYNKNHDQILREINNGKLYKSQRQATEAVQKVVDRHWNPFIKQEQSHSGSR